MIAAAGTGFLDGITSKPLEMIKLRQQVLPAVQCTTALLGSSLYFFILFLFLKFIFVFIFWILKVFFKFACFLFQVLPLCIFYYVEQNW